MPALLAVSLLGGCSDETSDHGGSSEQFVQGKQIVEANCVVCHSQGINGAPILGNRKMWDRRTAQGLDTLVEHAINGYAMDMMPPKGGNPDLSDADIRQAVQYMMSLVEE